MRDPITVLRRALEKYGVVTIKVVGAQGLVRVECEYGPTTTSYSLDAALDLIGGALSMGSH